VCDGFEGFPHSQVMMMMMMFSLIYDPVWRGVRGIVPSFGTRPVSVYFLLSGQRLVI
jgi:hypothetical protein